MAARQKRRFRWRKKWPLTAALVVLLAAGTAYAYYPSTGRAVPGLSRVSVPPMGTNSPAGEPSARTGGVSYRAGDPEKAGPVAASVLSGRTTARVIKETQPGVSRATYTPPVSVKTYGAGGIKPLPGASVTFKKVPG